MSKRKLKKEFHIRDIHFNQRATSKKRGHPPPSYTIAELTEWCLARPLYHTLHATWVQSGFVRLLAPSIDRIDDYKPYSIDNIQLMTAGENLKKAFKDCTRGANTKRSKGVIQETLDGVYVATYPSLNFAGRAMGAVNGSDICAVCLNKANSAFGFKWRYA